MYRGRGYGAQGLNLLCKAAAENGIEILYDDIARSEERRVGKECM